MDLARPTETDAIEHADELTDDVEGFRIKLPGPGNVPDEPQLSGGGGGLLGDLAGGLWKHTFKDTYDGLQQSFNHYF